MFTVHRIGTKYTHRNGIRINREHGTGDYLMLLIKTKAVVTTREKEYEINSPCIMIFPKDEMQSYYSLEKPFINDWVHFDGDEAAEFFAKLAFPLNEPIYVHNIPEISTMLTTLRAERWKNGRHLPEIMDVSLKNIFYKVSDAYEEESKVSDKLNRHRAAFNQVRNTIYTFKEDQSLNVNDLAKSINLSTSYFQHVYKQLYGVSVMQDIIKSRISYACTLLINTYDSISEIAERCGYENPEHFTRQFKEIEGCTPRQFRDNGKIY